MPQRHSLSRPQAGEARKNVLGLKLQRGGILVKGQNKNAQSPGGATFFLRSNLTGNEKISPLRGLMAREIFACYQNISLMGFITIIY